MHAFTRPSQQNKVQAAHLRSLHHTSQYRRLVLVVKADGFRTKETDQAIHIRLRSQSTEGTIILKFLYGQLYNGKTVKRYGHSPTDEFPLCHQPKSSTHIAGECSNQINLIINMYNAA
jgi:hypothetical protein